IVASLCDRVNVMYAGQIVEEADVVSLFHDPLHPYTRALIEGILRIDRPRDELRPIPGTVPDLAEMLPGCRFRSRCADAHERCAASPPMARIGDRSVRCWLHADDTQSSAEQTVAVRPGARRLGAPPC